MRTNALIGIEHPGTVPDRPALGTENAAWFWLGLFALCAAYLGLSGSALAQATGSTPDVAAPLALLQTARTKAGNATLTATAAQTGLGNLANVVLVGMALVGIGAASWSGISLYGNVQQGEQARGSNMTYTIALIIGSFLTIIAIIIGVITNYVVT